MNSDGIFCFLFATHLTMKFGSSEPEILDIAHKRENEQRFIFSSKMC